MKRIEKDMKRPIISLIAAIGKNRELGKDNKLLWHIPEDMKRFKNLTTGHVVIMGRKTYESIGKALPNRINIVITKDRNYHAPNCTIVHSLDEAIHIAKEKEKDEIFIIGGGQIYQQTMPYVDRLHLTVIDASADADTFFPNYSEFKKTIFKHNRTYRYLTYTFHDLVK